MEVWAHYTDGRQVAVPLSDDATLGELRRLVAVEGSTLAPWLFIGSEELDGSDDTPLYDTPILDGCDIVVRAGDLEARARLQSEGVSLSKDAMLLAVAKGDVRRVKLFITSRLHQLTTAVSGETVDNFGEVLSTHKTPLLVAAEQGHMQVVQLLLQAGADPNVWVVRRHSRHTRVSALSVAVRTLNVPLVRLLHRYGAKPAPNYNLMLLALWSLDQWHYNWDKHRVRVPHATPQRVAEMLLVLHELFGLRLDNFERFEMQRLVQAGKLTAIQMIVCSSFVRQDRERACSMLLVSLNMVAYMLHPPRYHRAHRNPRYGAERRQRYLDIAQHLYTQGARLISSCLGYHSYSFPRFGEGFTAALLEHTPPNRLPWDRCSSRVEKALGTDSNAYFDEYDLAKSRGERRIASHRR